MKCFLCKLLILFSSVSIPVIIILLTICPQYTHDYNASFIDKMNRLERLHEPKIILVGNSNLAFGIQSDLIESALDMPVVNLGLHGGLGNVFHERMPLFNLSEGDIVVIAHLDYGDTDILLDPELALLTVENYFHYWKIFRMKDFPRVIGTIPRYAYKCLLRFIQRADRESSFPNNCYSRNAFNEYGDNVFPRAIEAGESEPSIHHIYINEICINRINRLYRYCKSQGATVVIAGAAILSGLPDFNEQEYISAQENIEKLAECPVISDFTDYILDKKFFYSSYRHLTNDGAILRTEQLIKDLQAYFCNYLSEKALSKDLMVEGQE